MCACVYVCKENIPQNKLQNNEYLSRFFFFYIVFNANERPFLLMVFHTNKGLWLNKNSSINYYKITQEKFEWYTLNLSDIVKLSGKISVWQAIHQIRLFVEDNWIEALQYITIDFFLFIKLCKMKEKFQNNFWVG